MLTSFTDKQGQEIILRYPQWEDLDQMTEYINRLSQENTYIRFSGEEITKEEEGSFLEDVLKKIAARNGMMVLALAGEKLIGIAEVRRNTVNKKRSYHAGEFGISLAPEFRGRGIGERLAEVVLTEAERSITGLRLIYLTVYAVNERGYELYKKLGFKEVGRIPEFILHNGQYVDEIMMVRKV